MLHLIAETLGVPISLLQEPRGEKIVTVGSGEGYHFEEIEDFLTLLGLFNDLNDREARQRCLAYVRSEVDRARMEHTDPVTDPKE